MGDLALEVRVHMDIQIDHVVIAGKNLDEMRAGFTSVGLTPDEGGTHADGQTHNVLIGFEDGSYLELIAPVPGGTAPDHAWSQYMNNNAGVCAWAIRSNDIRADVEMFRQRGITVSDPTPGGRNRPDGVRLEWITAQLGDGPLGSVLPFLIQDVTPRELRVPRTQSAEGLIRGVAEVVVSASAGNLDSAIELFRETFDWSISDTKPENKPYISFLDEPVTIVAVGMGALEPPPQRYLLAPCLYMIVLASSSDAASTFSHLQDSTWWNYQSVKWFSPRILNPTSGQTFVGLLPKAQQNDR